MVCLRFDDLFNFVCDPGTLLVAFDRVAGNTGANTPGVDGLTVAEVEASIGAPGFLNDLRAQLKVGLFRPLPVLERRIPKRARAGQGVPQGRDPDRTRRARGQPDRHAARGDPVPAAGQHRPERARGARTRAVGWPGGTMGTPRRRARRRQQNLPNWRIVRYADDFVVLVHGARGDVEALREDLAEVLAPLGSPRPRPRSCT